MAEVALQNGSGQAAKLGTLAERINDEHKSCRLAVNAALVDFAVMSRATPQQRRRALGTASDDEIRRYRQSIDRALDNLKKWEAGEEGHIEQDQETLATQKAFWLALRAETDPFDLLPPSREQRAARVLDRDASVGVGA